MENRVKGVNAIKTFLSLQQKRQVEYTNFTPYIPNFYHPDRVLEEHDLVYMLEGSWKIGQEGIHYPIQKGDVFFLPAGFHHYGASPWSEHASNVFVHFAPCEGDVFETSPPSPAGGVVLPTVISCGDRPVVRQLFYDLVATFRGDSLVRQDKLSALLALLLCEIGEQAARRGAVDRIVEQATHHIHTHIDTFHSIDTLAQLTGVSRRTLTARFRAQTGKTVHQYQTEQKLTLARLQLKNEPYLLLQEIAQQYGFYDEFHFIRVFKRQYGITPGEYRSTAVLSKEITDRIE